MEIKLIGLVKQKAQILFGMTMLGYHPAVCFVAGDSLVSLLRGEGGEEILKEEFDYELVLKFLKRCNQLAGKLGSYTTMIYKINKRMLVRPNYNNPLTRNFERNTSQAMVLMPKLNKIISKLIKHTNIRKFPLTSTQIHLVKSENRKLFAEPEEEGESQGDAEAKQDSGNY